MAKLSKFKQDIQKSEEGAKVDLGDGLIVTVARVGNSHYQETLKSLTKPYKNAIKNGTLSDSVFEKMMVQAMAEAILLDWEGMEGEDGKLIPYSKDKAKEILGDPAYKDFRELISDLANEAETFRQQEIEEISKS